MLASRAILWNADRACEVLVATCCLNVRPESNQIPSHRTTSFGSITSLFSSLRFAVLASFPVVKCMSSVFARSNCIAFLAPSS